MLYNPENRISRVRVKERGSKELFSEIEERDREQESKRVGEGG